MNVYNAIAACFSEELYLNLKRTASPPELLKMAALECFVHPKDKIVEDTLRSAMLHLWTEGVMPK